MPLALKSLVMANDRFESGRESSEEASSHEIPDVSKRRKQTLSKLGQRQLEPGHQDDVKAAHEVVEGKGAAGEVD